MKNPFDSLTPEWQLFENMISAEKAAAAFDRDAEAYRLKSAEQRERASLYSEALAKLSGDFRIPTGEDG